jgi:hypothetical protein
MKIIHIITERSMVMVGIMPCKRVPGLIGTGHKDDCMF